MRTANASARVTLSSGRNREFLSEMIPILIQASTVGEIHSDCHFLPISKNCIISFTSSVGVMRDIFTATHNNSFLGVYLLYSYSSSVHRFAIMPLQTR